MAHPTCAACKVEFATLWGAKEHSRLTGHAYVHDGQYWITYTAPKGFMAGEPPEYAAPNYRLDCPRPVMQGSDEYHCTVCGRTWDVHDERPQCGKEL
jgi:hypothetical protein